MKKINKILLTALFISSAVIISPHKNIDAASRITFVVVYPGSSSSINEGKRMIKSFVKTIASMTGIPAYRLKGEFFNSQYKAEQYLRYNPNSFVMGSMGFYLKNKYRYKLQPLSKVSMRGSTKEQYHVMVKKGTYSSLRSLQYKKIGGNILKEHNRYITKVVFNNQAKAQNFKMNKRYSTLRAIKRVARGRFAGVVIDNIEYSMVKSSIRSGNSMARIFKKLKKVYSSPRYPALGFMMTNTYTTRSVKGKIVKTMSSLCSLPEGRGVCKNFGISGFVPVFSGEMNYVIKKYNAR